MKTRAKIYIRLISLAGILLGLMCCYAHFMPYLRAERAFSFPAFAIPVLICALCRSLPITIRDGETLDLSVISVLAVYLIHGAAAAAVMYMVSSLFTFEPMQQDKKYRHLFTIGAEKVFFNDSTIILSIVLPALLIRALCSWVPGDMNMPGVLLPAALFSLFTFVINGLLQMTMFCLNGMISPADMLHMMLGLTPNVIAAMPMGLFMGYMYASPTMIWMVFIMILPLLLARYAWKLYLYSENARTHLVMAFINSVEAKDKYTQGHSERVGEYALMIAREMKLPRRQVQLIRQGAVLHDIGKIGISDSILNKPCELNEEETAIMHTHPLIGGKMLEKVGLEDEVLEMVRCHHEHYNGNGYPQGLKASELSPASRILCVADAYDAMTSDRPYRKAMTREIALEILVKNRNTQFDPVMVDAFIRALEKN